MDFSNGSDPKIVFAFWLGVAVVAVTLMMLAIIIVMRQVTTRRERNHEAAVQKWTGLLDTLKPAELPTLAARDLQGFVNAWISRAGPGGDSAGHLRSVASAVGLEKHLIRLIDATDFNDRVLAITALGHLREAWTFDRLVPFLADRSPVVSLCAASALMRIDPAKAVDLFVPQIVRRSDWARGRVAAILRGAQDPVVAKALSEATLQANADLAPRLVRFLASVSPEQASTVIRTILRSRADDHLISTCLQVMSNPRDLDLVRPMLAHERWHVRMHAATAVGRLGAAGDEALLVGLLSDREWWVRYRAAQALTQMPFLDDDDLFAIGARQTDRFAIDALGHVMAEQKLGLLA